jgi:hypothetical protein
MGKKIGKSFRKIRRISREIRGKVFAGFSGFSGIGVIFGTVVMARRTGRRDHGGAGFPAWWPTTVLGRHAMGDGPSAGGAGGIRDMRVEGSGVARILPQGMPRNKFLYIQFGCTNI